MKRSTARVVANAILISAGAAAVGVLIVSPRARRLAGIAARLWLGASVPVLVLGEVKQAWEQSAGREPTQ